MKTLEQKQAIARALSPDQLLDLYDAYFRTFNPFDDDKCESFNILREEVLKRLKERNITE